MLLFNASSYWEKITFLLLSLICLILGLDYKFTLLPFHGVYLIAYLLFLIISTTWLTFICLQTLLRLNKPCEYDIENNTALRCILRAYNVLKSWHGSACIKSSRIIGFKSKRATKNIDERIDDLVRDIELRFILKWYVHISEDPSFPNECKALLDEIVRRFLQIIIEVDGRKLIYGCVVIFLKHVKEIRKAVKRVQKNGGTIQDVYRYSHVGSKSTKAMEHFIFHLTANILCQFVNWELWVSLPCQSLVSILSKRFTTYILTSISTPGFLNYKLVQICASPTVRSDLKLDDFYFISVADVDHSGNLKGLDIIDVPDLDTKKKALDKLKNNDSDTPLATPKRITQTVTSDRTDAKKSFHKFKGKTTTLSSNPIDIFPSRSPVKSEAKLENTDNLNKVEPRAAKTSEPVKIYESKSSTNKTWRNSSDLECISLGQDLLAFQEFSDPDSQIQELIEKKLWKDNAEIVEEDKSGSMWDIVETWYGEEETNDIPTSPTSNFQSYLKSTANTASYITNTIKPIGNVTANTLQNMKELQQSTVNTVNTVVKPMSQATTNAMHKIGDLQDEAAGMVEGIFDFGMAGLRKGLRLTGLQENFSELTQKAKNEFHKGDGHKPSEFHKFLHSDKDANKKVKTNVKRIMCEEKSELTQMSVGDSENTVWINPLTKESPSFDGHILLEKTPDSLPQSSGLEAQQGLENIFSSPDSDTSPFIHDIPQITTEDIVLSRNSPDLEYEETQDFATTIAKLRTLLQQKSSESGVTTPALSPLMHDELAKTPNEPPPADLSKVDGAMPSLYKFCARTATGVFQNTLNTIKTALPGNVNDSNASIIRSSLDDWTFVEADSANDDFHSRMKKLLSERRAFCTVDTAYEAIDSLEIIDHQEMPWTASVPQFDDDLDELDVQVPITKALVDIVCELVGDTNTCLLQESAIKAILLLVGNYSENLITKRCDNILHNVNKFVGKLPDNINQDVLALKLEDVVDVCLDAFPYYSVKLLGRDTLKTAVEVFVVSLQSQRINQDMFMQMFELFASELIGACSQVSPAYSA